MKKRPKWLKISERHVDRLLWLALLLAAVLIVAAVFYPQAFN
ncbi:MAG: hypothetical protein OXG49_10085 [Chloroflexi bacterium]|nr:hypothetical protein [Chloroflexota bacterium]